jgi:hypothetical protein
VIPAPSIYAEWAVLIDRFSSGDDSVLEALARGTISWTNVVAERYTALVANALDRRLSALSQRLNRDLQRAGGDHHLFTQALIAARTGLVTAERFAGLSAHEARLREHLLTVVASWHERTRRSLEESLERLRDQGELLSLLRRTPLRATSVAPPVKLTAAPARPGDVPQRRIIL